MTSPIRGHTAGVLVICCLLLVSLAACALAAADTVAVAPEPVVYLNMNEGSGLYALDFSGNGNSGEIHDATRIRTGACGEALFFNGIDSYVAIPFRSKNHPETEITVDLWFSVDSYDRQVLVSTYNDGGYRLAFDDGNDLWWTVHTGRGDVSVPVQHEYIPLHRWHHLAGTYDGRVSRIYLDGVLRNAANASGIVSYSYANDVILGAEAGTGNQPDSRCAGYFKGGLDEVRIYNRALSYGEVMDDRFSCPQEQWVPEFTPSERILDAGCSGLSSSLTLPGSGQITQRIIISDPNQVALLNVRVPAGSTLSVNVQDAYAPFYPDYWYIEIGDSGRRLTRTITFPDAINTPADAVIPSGNATVLIRYFDGANRFPASAYVSISSTSPREQPAEPLHPIFSNPIIVIYTASWATLIAILLVIFWLHRRSKKNAG